MTARFPSAKDPGDSTPWSMDYSDEMTEISDTINTSSWSIPSGLTEVSNSKTNTVATVKLSGGTDGVDYTLTNTIVTTTNTFTFERSAKLRVREIDT